METLPEELLRDSKKNGFSDAQIAQIMRNCTEDQIYEKRKALGILRVYKMVDTCSAEFEAKTPYFYSTFE
jgi:carbamoyl-phosphate synthase large subunit